MGLGPPTGGLRPAGIHPKRGNGTGADATMNANDRIFAKVARRVIPFMVALYTVSFLDRVNVGFAALTMNKDLGFTPEIFGFGAGALFVSYAFFQIPANLILDRLGTRRWIFCILVAGSDLRFNRFRHRRADVLRNALSF